VCQFCLVEGMLFPHTSIGVTAEVARPCNECLVLVGARRDGVYADG
jgi:hypothetical protein